MLKMILIEADETDGCYCEEACYCNQNGTHTEPVVTQYESTKEVAAALVHRLAADRESMELLLNNPHFTQVMSDMGFKDVQKVKNAADKLKLTQKHYIVEGTRYGALSEVNLEKLTAYDAERLAKADTNLLQAVQKSSIRAVNPAAYKKLQAAKRRIAEAAKKKKETAAKRAAKKKEKELERARKLLAEAGE